jgi:hypothetical protein
MCPSLFAFVGFGAQVSAADLEVSFPNPPIASFTGEEIAVPVRIKNRGGSALDAEFFTRLWQMSSATLVPLGEMVPWWNGRVEAGAALVAHAKIAVPEFRAATRMRLQILDADRAPAARVEFVAIPRKWLHDELAALGAPPGLCDPQQRLAPAFRKLDIEAAPARDLEQLAALTGRVVLIIPPEDQIATVVEAAQRLAARGCAIVLIGDMEEKWRSLFAGGVIPKDIDFSESAPAQLKLGQWIREAVRRKQQNAVQPPANTR